MPVWWVTLTLIARAPYLAFLLFQFDLRFFVVILFCFVFKDIHLWRQRELEASVVYAPGLIPLEARGECVIPLQWKL